MWITSCCSMSLCRDGATTDAASVAAPSPASSPSPASPPVHPGPSTGDIGGGQQVLESPVAVRRQEEPAASTSAAASLGVAAPVGLPPLAKGRSSDKLDSVDAASVASSQKHSTRSARSYTSSIGSEFINEQIPEHKRQVARIQGQMKAFVKGMVKGRDMTILSVDGQLRTCTCSFDRKLRTYNILLSKETREIPLNKFREVFQGTEPEDISTPLDELCCTFVLANGECLTFRFKDVEERENFAMCLQIIVDGHQ